MAQAVIIALHYQNDVVHPDGRIKVGLGNDNDVRTNLILNASKLLAFARDNGWPIVHVRVAYRPDYSDLVANAPILKGVIQLGAVVDGTWGAEFFEGLGPNDVHNEFVLTHKRINAFHGTNLKALIEGWGARNLIFAGVATHSVVESSVRHAVDCGYTVSVASDACASATKSTHQASLKNMSLIAKVITVDDLVRGAL